SKNNDKVLAILFIDLDGFKQINDVYGHATGDDVLTIVARRLEFTIRKSDCLSRIGGDEYLIGLLMNKENYAEVESMAEKFSTVISEPMNVDGISLKVGASIGIAAYPMHGNQIKTLMDIADRKMYQVKKRKKSDSKKEKNEQSHVIIFPGKSNYSN
ncbi:MAG TPA: GGDEF domain-containing protein, partial [Leucothrix sp.]|nr:GGDEF domain-containing protein [Leucothrix sp.]